MFEQSKYQHIWYKYSPAIRVLLKKTDNSTQKLQLYKHEFEYANKKDKLGYSFSFEVVNGKIANITGGSTVARDLIAVIDSITLIKTWLKEHHVKFSMDKSFELVMEKVELSQN